jgi:Fic family protein
LPIFSTYRAKLRPALDYAKERKIITPQEASVLLKAAQLGEVKAGDLAETMPGLSQGQRTYQIRKLVERKMLLPLREGSRQYIIGFSNSYLLRGIIGALSGEGFVSSSLNAP